jgi:prepilin-type N-terminal cleavage/methylation domain-containing protein
MTITTAQRGFTLIELLVVIAIIGVLSSIVLASMNQARKKARDAQRRSGLKSLQVALELYYDTNGAYPATPASTWYSSEPSDPAALYNGGDYIPGLAPTHIKILPRDPSGTVGTISICATYGWKRAYNYRSDGQNYKLVSHCTLEAPITTDASYFDPVRPTHGWMICSGDAACSTW